MPLLAVATTVVLPVLMGAVSVVLVFGGAFAAVILLQALAALLDAPAPVLRGA